MRNFFREGAKNAMVSFLEDENLPLSWLEVDAVSRDAVAVILRSKNE